MSSTHLFRRLQQIQSHLRPLQSTTNTFSSTSTSHTAASFTTTATSTSPSLSSYSRLESQFQSHISSTSIEQLHAAITDNCIITISGDQCTGKSTLATRLALLFSGKHTQHSSSSSSSSTSSSSSSSSSAHSSIHENYKSAGSLFRQKAKEMNISLPQL